MLKPNPVALVLPADIYDTLELSALAFGGIGGGKWLVSEYVGDNRASFADNLFETVPCCLEGHCDYATLAEYNGGSELNAEIEQLLYENDGGPISPIVFNDTLVERINRARGKPDTARVTFKSYVKYGNIVRGQ